MHTTNTIRRTAAARRFHFPIIRAVVATAMVAAFIVLLSAYVYAYFADILLLVADGTTHGHVGADADVTKKDNHINVAASVVVAAAKEDHSKNLPNRLQITSSVESHASSLELESESEFDPFSTIITNDIPWYDDNGNILETGRGGKISLFDGWYWWIGTRPIKNCTTDGGDIYLYKSLTAGSNSWQFVRKIWHFPLTSGGAGNCQIHKHPTNGAIIIHCKSLKFLVSDTGIMGRFRWIVRPLPRDPSHLPTWTWGGTTVFRDGNDMYMAASRCDRSKPKPGKTRTGFIYKLRDDWLGFDETDPIVVQFPWQQREAYHIFQYDEWYYLAASSTRGWKPSDSWYRRSRTLEGLGGVDVQEHQMIMHPATTNISQSSHRDVLSMGTQFRFLMELAPGKWIFAGSRHPDEDPEDFDARFGRYVICPVQFLEGVPNVYWKRQFQWDVYNYSSGDYDPRDYDNKSANNTTTSGSHSVQEGLLQEVGIE